MKSNSKFSKLNFQVLSLCAEAANINLEDLEKILKISKNSLDDKTRSHLLSFVKITDLAYNLFDKNKDKTLKWLLTSNDLFLDNLPPYEMALCGKGKNVIEKLEEYF